MECVHRKIGTKKLKAGGKQLKGWWDREVKTAINNRKRANRQQRKLKNKLNTHGEQYRQAWEEAWENYRKEKKIARSDQQ